MSTDLMTEQASVQKFPSAIDTDSDNQIFVYYRRPKLVDREFKARN